MNLIQFLKQVDRSVSRLSQKELEAFVHEIARTLPEHNRDSFLAKLRAAGKNPEAGTPAFPTSGTSAETLRQKISQLEKELARIEEGRIGGIHSGIPGVPARLLCVAARPQAGRMKVYYAVWNPQYM